MCLHVCVCVHCIQNDQASFCRPQFDFEFLLFRLEWRHALECCVYAMAHRVQCEYAWRAPSERTKDCEYCTAFCTVLVRKCMYAGMC